MGGNLMHTCANCRANFDQWMLYKMHIELYHTSVVAPEPLKGAKKLTKAQIRAIVQKGEARIGLQHFIGDHV